VVLNNCDIDNAMERAEELRQSVARSPVYTANGPIPVTASVGVLSSRQWESLPAEDILRGVDAALYAAKAAGRNCCRLATPAGVELNQ
jgi:diguanylate cyclase (GGDEF)-like protein